jgi:hypothetical protein
MRLVQVESQFYFIDKLAGYRIYQWKTIKVYTWHLKRNKRSEGIVNIKVIIRYFISGRPIFSLPFVLTARQYGEVVLTDDSTGQSPGTLAGKLSRCKEGMAHFLPSRYKFYWGLRVSRYKFDRSREFIPGYKFGCGHWRSVAVQFVSEPEICQGAGF